MLAPLSTDKRFEFLEPLVRQDRLLARGRDRKGRIVEHYLIPGPAGRRQVLEIVYSKK